MSNIALSKILGKSRRAEYVSARQMVWYLAHDFSKIKYTKIAKHYNRDHTTIISGAKKMRGNEAVRQVIGDIRAMYPEIFEPVGNSLPKNIENWNVEVVHSLSTSENTDRKNVV